MNITRDQAICMFFYVNFTEENVKRCKKKLEELGEAEICWNADRRQPVVVHKLRIKGDPFTYKKYLDTTETDDCPSSAAAQNSATYSSTKDGAHEEMLRK